MKYIISALVALLIVCGFGYLRLRHVINYEVKAAGSKGYTRKAGEEAPTNIKPFTKEMLNKISNGEGFNAKFTVEGDPRNADLLNTKEIIVEPAPKANFNRPARRALAEKAMEDYEAATEWIKEPLSFQHNIIVLIDGTEGGSERLTTHVHHAIKDLAQVEKYLERGDKVKIRLAVIRNEGNWIYRNGRSFSPVTLEKEYNMQKVNSVIHNAIDPEALPSSAIALNLAEAIKETTDLPNRKIVVVSDGIENDPNRTFDCYSTQGKKLNEDEIQVAAGKMAKLFPEKLNNLEIVWQLIPSRSVEDKNIQKNSAIPVWNALFQKLGIDLKFQL